MSDYRCGPCDRAFQLDECMHALGDGVYRCKQCVDELLSTPAKLASAETKLRVHEGQAKAEIAELRTKRESLLVTAKQFSEIIRDLGAKLTEAYGGDYAGKLVVAYEAGDVLMREIAEFKTERDLLIARAESATCLLKSTLDIVEKHGVESAPQWPRVLRAIVALLEGSQDTKLTDDAKQ